MRRPPSSGSVPDAATPASSLAGSVPAGISVRRTAPAREVKDVVRALAAPWGPDAHTSWPRALPRYRHYLGARPQLSYAYRCVGAEAGSGKTGERVESAAGAPRSARRRETLFHPERPKSKDRLAPVSQIRR